MKTTYTIKEVKEIIEEVLESVQDEVKDNLYEKWLNDQWLNNNNWQNEDRREDFMDELIESFMY